MDALGRRVVVAGEAGSRAEDLVCATLAAWARQSFVLVLDLSGGRLAARVLEALPPEREPLLYGPATGCTPPLRLLQSPSPVEWAAAAGLVALYVRDRAPALAATPAGGAFVGGLQVLSAALATLARVPLDTSGAPVAAPSLADLAVLARAPAAAEHLVLAPLAALPPHTPAHPAFAAFRAYALRVWPGVWAQAPLPLREALDPLWLGAASRGRASTFVGRSGGPDPVRLRERGALVVALPTDHPDQGLWRALLLAWAAAAGPSASVAILGAQCLAPHTLQGLDLTAAGPRLLLHAAAPLPIQLGGLARVECHGEDLLCSAAPFWRSEPVACLPPPRHPGAVARAARRTAALLPPDGQVADARALWAPFLGSFCPEGGPARSPTPAHRRRRARIQQG